MIRCTLRAVPWLVIGLLLGACAPTAAPSTPPATATPVAGSALPGSEWVLTSLRGQPLLPGSHISLKLERDSLGGFAGCNAYGGRTDGGTPIAADDGRLNHPLFDMTVMLCLTPAGVMEQEKAYTGAFLSASTYRLIGDRLELQNAAGETVLVYTRQEEAPMDPADLPGTQWRLVSLDGQSPVEGSTVTLVFLDGKWLGGHAGCREYICAYQAVADDLGLPSTAMMGPLCPDEAAQAQEGQYTTVLEWARNYSLAQGRLEIKTARGETLVYEPLPAQALPPLEGPTWSLVAMVEVNPAEGLPVPLPMPGDVMSGTEITLVLDGGMARGSAGCNSYQAPYSGDTAIAFGPVAATEKACLTPAGVMEQEQRYLRLLPGVTDYRLGGGQLWLLTGDGQALLFVVQTSK